MNIKNTGASVVSIGTIIILPDETVNITEAAYQDNAAIKHLVKMGRLAVEKSGTVAPAKTEPPVDETPEEVTDETPDEKPEPKTGKKKKE